MKCPTCEGQGVFDEIDTYFYPYEIKEIKCPDCEEGEIEKEYYDENKKYE
tara:strand:+ start:394 stop:543 length:150 start_codon:yes stop_codon:yes gene_type:complete